MHVLITRPTEDAAPLASKLTEAGIESSTEALLDIVYLNEPLPDLGSVQGLLITSANGIRAFARLNSERNVSVWAVGDASARMARGLGFADVHSASGNVDALVRLVGEEVDAAAGDLLHIAGTEVAGDLGGQLERAGYAYKRCVLYEARIAGGFSDTVLAQFITGSFDGVMLYSPRTAETFAKLTANAGLDDTLGNVTAFCLSMAVGQKIKDLHWKRIVVAKTPDEASLIAEVLEAAAKV